jgi:ribosomal protein S6
MTEKTMSIEAGKELYEIGVHFVASLAETQAQEAYQTLQANLSKNAEVATTSELDLIDLAYTMVTTIDRKNERFDSAYFGTITFISTPEYIKEIDATLTLDENVLRHIIVKTVPNAQAELEKCQELVKEDEEDEEGDSPEKESSTKEKEAPVEEKESEEAKPEMSKEKTDDIDQKIEEIVS